MAVMSGMTGCTAICDGIISIETDARNDVLAQKAWGHWSWVYDDLDHPWHFARGFKAGYRNILEGGSGCQPTFPPQCYWKPCYQTLTGNCKTHAWFDGFSHGALAAKQDGYGYMGHIPISPTARANIEAARRPAKQNAFGDEELPGEPMDIDGVPGELLPAQEDGGENPQVLPPIPARPMLLRPYE